MSSGPAVLVTGGAGYVGSHVVVELALSGYKPVVLDNFVNSSPTAVDAVGRLLGEIVPCIHADVRDRVALRETFEAFSFTAVIHCAGLKSVGEAEAFPLLYYEVNVGGTLILAAAMQEAGIGTMVFSSSATVYGEPEVVPVSEDAPVQPRSVYGRTKLMVESFLRDLAGASPWRIALLRYFNPAGAHESGDIGEAGVGQETNIFPAMCRVASGEVPFLEIWGCDWPTEDGTGVRDYLHVQDLAAGHVAALEFLTKNEGAAVLNLGMGRGYSVREVVAAFEQASGRAIPVRYSFRRPGDVARCFADASLAESALGWRATRDMSAICVDAWRWHQNRNG